MRGFLPLRLAGPLQSWGARSNFLYRDTQRYPTLSGVVGMVMASQGLRDCPPDFADLNITIRIDKPGELIEDFQTVQDVISANGKNIKPVLTDRLYLADASFLAILEGPVSLLESIRASLQNPIWEPYLGRRSCVPSEIIAQYEIQETLDAALQVDWPRGVDSVRVVQSGDSTGGAIVYDRPDGQGGYTPRFITQTTIERTL